MNDLLLMEILCCPDKFSEDTAHKSRSEQRTMGRCDIKQIAARGVCEHQNGSRRLNTESLEIDQRRVMYALKDLELALQAHLNTILTRASSWAMLADLHSNQRLPFRWAFVRFVLTGRDLAGCQHNLTESALTEAS